jgi:hypothetical protein
MFRNHVPLIVAALLLACSGSTTSNSTDAGAISSVTGGSASIGGDAAGGSSAAGGSVNGGNAAGGGTAGLGGSNTGGTRQANCPDAARQQVEALISQIVQKPEYDSCTETGIARGVSTQCRYDSALSHAVSLALSHASCMSWWFLRSDVNESALLAEIQQAVGDLYCPNIGCAGPAPPFCLRGQSTGTVWCVSSGSSSGNCDYQEICQCANGQLLPRQYECDGNPDCSDGSDEQGCCSNPAGWVYGSCSPEGSTCFARAGSSSSRPERCTCNQLVWTCSQY